MKPDPNPKIRKKKKEFLRLINTLNDSENVDISNPLIPTKKHSQLINNTKHPPFIPALKTDKSSTSASPYQEMESEKNLIRLKNMVSIYKSKTENIQKQKEEYQDQILELKKFIWNEPELKRSSMECGDADVIGFTRQVIKMLLQSNLFGCVYYIGSDKVLDFVFELFFWLLCT